jgi:AcrR family transcriptional regulator
LIKRFGSKHGLLVAIDQRWADGIEATYARISHGHDDPVQRLRAGALLGFDAMDDPNRVTNLITALANDLADPELRKLLAAGWGAMQEQLRQLATHAIEAGRLPSAPDADQVARILFSVGEGTRLAWAVAPHGSLLARAEQDIDALLDAWRR